MATTTNRARKRPTYSDDQIREALRQYKQRGEPIRRSAIALGVSPTTLARWIKQPQRAADRMIDLQQTVDRLQRENQILRDLLAPYLINQKLVEASR